MEESVGLGKEIMGQAIVCHVVTNLALISFICPPCEDYCNKVKKERTTDSNQN